MKILNALSFVVRKQDITIVQMDQLLGPEDHGHAWLAMFYGEPIGKITYSYLRGSWKVTSQLYCKKEELVSETKMLDGLHDYGGGQITKKEIREIRKCRKVLARYLNKNRYCTRNISD